MRCAKNIKRINLRLLVMIKSIAQVLIEAVSQLKNNSDSPKLDAEILLAHSLQKARSFLYSHPEYVLSEPEQQLFWEMIAKRATGMPIAYIVEQKEFWSLLLKVTDATLIPRPETEILVEQALKLFSKDSNISIVDLGTGGGAIAIAIAYERPTWQVIATDISAAALSVAQENANALKLRNVTFLQGAWCAALPPQKFDLIISNPPYIANDDSHLLQPELTYEPQMALISGADGLDAIRNIAQNALAFLKSSGYLLLEHGYDQAEQVREILRARGFQNIQTLEDYSGHARVTLGCNLVD